MGGADCPPRFGTPRSDRPTYGEAVAETARRLGIVLLPWQRHVADVALEHDDGRLRFRDAVVTVPRQSGKTVLLMCVLVHRMLASPGQRLAYGAQNRLSARGKLFEELWPMLGRSPLGPMFKLSRATGAESLRCSNGSLLTLLSAEESAGHGLSLDLVLLDECWALEAATEQAVRPTMATRPNGQLWAFSTAGTSRSAWWRDRCEAGRAAVTTGLTEGAAFFEWSAGDDVDETDPSTWPSFMPALGHTIDEAVVKADMSVMAPAEWRRAFANQWADEHGQGWKIIGQDIWAASRL